MYILDIKDLEVEPKIIDSKVISNNNRDVVMEEAEKYIQDKYSGKYNPHTLRRKIFDAVKNIEGKTYGEEIEARQTKEFEEEDRKFKERQDIRYKKLEEDEKIIEKKYHEQCEALNVEWQAEIDKTTNDEEIKIINDKFETIRDGYAWEKDKAVDELNKNMDEEFVEKINVN